MEELPIESSALVVDNDDQHTITANDPQSSISKENFKLLLATTKHTILRSNSNDFSGGGGGSQSQHIVAIPKSSPGKIQKQISLYERDSSASGSDYNKLTHELDALTRSPGKIKIQKRWIDGCGGGGSAGGDQPQNSMSVDNLQNVTKIDAERIAGSASTAAAASTEMPPPGGNKTKSCINLKTCGGAANASPGAVVVKEKFIEPPLRVAKSFHGNTSFASKYKSRKVDCGTVEQLGGGLSTDNLFNNSGSLSKLNRFTATRVTESNELAEQRACASDDGSTAPPSDGDHRF